MPGFRKFCNLFSFHSCQFQPAKVLHFVPKQASKQQFEFSNRLLLYIFFIEGIIRIFELRINVGDDSMGNWAEAPFKSLTKKKKWNFREPLGHTTSTTSIRLPDSPTSSVWVGGWVGRCERVGPTDHWPG